jgi:hypothetical protein
METATMAMKTTAEKLSELRRALRLHIAGVPMHGDVMKEARKYLRAKGKRQRAEDMLKEVERRLAKLRGY